MVRLYYSLGGINYWTYKNDRRGYYLSVTPVKIRDHGGYSMIESCPMDGLKYLVKSVNRRSAKADKEAGIVARDMLDTLIDTVCAKHGIARSDLGDLVFD